MKVLKKIKYNAPVILTFTLLAFAALILGYITNGWTTEKFFMVYRTPLSHPLLYLRLFTHVLGHSNLEHFVNNFMIILLVGPMLEEKYGSKQLGFMIVATAFITGLINVLFFNHALLGASGIAFMLILLSSFGNSAEGTIPLTLIFVATIYLGNEIISGIISQDNISQLSHIIGGICGCGIGYMVKPDGSSKKY